ncbi:MAG: geranyl-CoA carboxylase alpha subunit [Paracoccaceae bacterium]|jgi:geranyl-CoA carboxylase alpha subunit
MCVAPSDIVQVGTRLAVLEAMNMQQDLLSEVAGTVTVVPMAAGTQVKAGDLLVEISVGDAE